VSIVVIIDRLFCHLLVQVSVSECGVSASILWKWKPTSAQPQSPEKQS